MLTTCFLSGSTAFFFFFSVQTEVLRHFHAGKTFFLHLCLHNSSSHLWPLTPKQCPQDQLSLDNPDLRHKWLQALGQTVFLCREQVVGSSYRHCRPFSIHQNTRPSSSPLFFIVPSSLSPDPLLTHSLYSPPLPLPQSTHQSLFRAN